MNITVVYALAHALLDFACAFAYFANAAPNFSDWAILALIYNLCAFGLQAPLGLLADKLNYNAALAILGCLVAAVGCGFVLHPLALVILAGLGSALFYVGSGTEILNYSQNKCLPVGIFLASGSVGWYFGTSIGCTQPTEAAVWPILAIITATALIAVFQYKKDPSFKSDNLPCQSWALSKTAYIASLLLILVTVLRSYMGCGLALSWVKSSPWLVMLALFIGQSIGGFLSDRFGLMKTASLSLLLASVFFVWSENTIVGFLAVLSLAISTPIVFWTLAKIVPDKRGLSFGLLGGAMFLGFLPLDFNIAPLAQAPSGYIVGSLLILASLYVALRLAYDIVKPIDQSSPKDIKSAMMSDHTIIVG